MSLDEERDNPYVGLRPFFDDDSLYFFGRREQTSDLLDALQKSRFVPVLGSSGSGKSSLVRAGLIPTLQAGFMVADREAWRMAKCRPGDVPLENLASALLKAAGQPRDAAAVLAFADQLRDEHVDAVLALFRPIITTHENIFILVDQFEELFAFRLAAGAESDEDPGSRSDQGRTAERLRRRSDASTLVSLLVALAEQSVIPIYVVLTMRTDFLGDCDLFTGLPEAINHSGYLVPRLTRVQLRQTIEGPARLMGATVTPRLVDRILNDVGDRGDRLPLMQHALHRAWDAWDAEGRIGPMDLVHLDGVGGLDKALDKEGEEVITGTPLAVVERVLKRLTDTDANNRRVRRPTRRSDLLSVAGAGADVVQPFLDRCAREGTNFLYASDDGKPDDPRYAIAHESLIRQWDRLRRWVEEEQALRDWFYEMANLAAEYRKGKDVGLLNAYDTRIALDMVRVRAPSAQWATRYGDAASTFAEVMAYITESHRQSEIIRRRWRGLLSGVAAVVLVATVLVVRSGSQAKDALARADALGFTAALEKLAVEDPTYAHALAAELPVTGPWDVGRTELVQRILAGTPAIAEFRDVAFTQFMPDGAEVVIARTDRTIEVRRSDGTGEPRARWTHDQPIDGLTVDARGRVLTSGGGENYLLRWTPGRPRPDTLTGPQGAGELNLFEASPDRRWVVALNPTMGQMYALRDGDTAFTEVLLDRDVQSLEFHPTLPGLLAVRDIDDSVSLFDLDRSLPLVALPGGPRFAMSPDARTVLVTQHNAPVQVFTLNAARTRVTAKRSLGGSLSFDAAFAPDGRHIAITTADGFVELYDLTGQTPLWRVPAHSEWTDVMYTREGEWIMSSSSDGTIRLTNAADPTAVIPLLGHRAPVIGRDRSADGTRLYTLDAEGVARVWEPLRLNAITRMTPYLGRQTNIVMASSGQRLIAAEAAGFVSVFNLGAPNPPGGIGFSVNQEPPLIMAISADGAQGLFLFPMSGLMHWRIGGAATPIAAGRDTIKFASFSPDGNAVVVGTADGRLWVTSLDTSGASPVVFQTSRPESAVFTSDGRHLVFLSNASVLLSKRSVLRGDVRTGTVDTLSQRSTQFSAGSTLLLSPDDLTLSVGHLAEPSFLLEFPKMYREGPVAAYGAFSPDGRRIALATREKSVVIRSTIFGDSAPHDIVLRGMRDNVVHLVFGRDGRSLVTTGQDGEVRLWTEHDTLWTPLRLEHVPRVPFSEFIINAWSALSEDGLEIRSVVQAPGQSPRVRAWRLAPAAIREQLWSATTACPPPEYRRRVLTSEFEAAAAQHYATCEARATRPRPSAP